MSIKQINKLKFDRTIDRFGIKDIRVKYDCAMVSGDDGKIAIEVKPKFIVQCGNGFYYFIGKQWFSSEKNTIMRFDEKPLAWDQYKKLTGWVE